MELEQLDLIVALVRLRDLLTELAVTATTDGPEGCRWVDVADVLEQAARLCRREVLIDQPCGAEPRARSSSAAPVRR